MADGVIIDVILT